MVFYRSCFSMFYWKPLESSCFLHAAIIHSISLLRDYSKVFHLTSWQRYLLSLRAPFRHERMPSFLHLLVRRLYYSLRHRPPPDQQSHSQGVLRLLPLKDPPLRLLLTMTISR